MFTQKIQTRQRGGAPPAPDRWRPDGRGASAVPRLPAPYINSPNCFPFTYINGKNANCRARAASEPALCKYDGFM